MRKSTLRIFLGSSTVLGCVVLASTFACKNRAFNNGLNSEAKAQERDPNREILLCGRTEFKDFIQARIEFLDVPAGFVKITFPQPPTFFKGPTIDLGWVMGQPTYYKLDGQTIGEFGIAIDDNGPTIKVELGYDIPGFDATQGEKNIRYKASTVDNTKTNDMTDRTSIGDFKAIQKIRLTSYMSGAAEKIFVFTKKNCNETATNQTTW